MRKYIAGIMVLSMVLLFSGCGGVKKLDQPAILKTEGVDHEEYLQAAKNYFSDMTNFDAGEPTIAEDSRYIMLASETEDILNTEKFEGKRFTILIHDSGQENVMVILKYTIGTTENSIKKGSVVNGEMTFNDKLAISLKDVEQKDRAKTIFMTIYNRLLEIEKK